MIKIINRSNNWIRKSTTGTNTKVVTHNSNSTPALATTFDPPALQGPTSHLNVIKNSYCVHIPPCRLAHWLSYNSSLQLICKPKFVSLQHDMSRAANVQPKHKNRLAQEKSPYLLQHAHNPVNWYPWCAEAIERARCENKIIFLSVGYSTCHWCHVMERESFENEAVAAIMNKNFVNIKVDREERPDIDKIYMQFVLMMNGSGGWPMSVWLTPDLAPIAGGTYFPPQDRWSMPSFTSVLNTIASKWTTNQEELKRSGLNVIAVVQKTLSEKESEAKYEQGCVDAKLKETLNIFKRRYDQQFGGFGAAPKFPEVSRLNFLFHAYIVTKDADVLDMALETLHHIGRGGIHDHIFGGFARYSVDRKWHVPHFEKMLYDQGQLMAAYANGYKLTREPELLQYADGIFRYLMKDLRHPHGGFYSGEDADSLPTADAPEKIEGAFYAWTWEEVKQAIEDNCVLYEPFGIELARVFEIYAFHYDLRPAGNVDQSSDPHGHLKQKNILIVRSDGESETCANFNISKEQLKSILDTTNNILHDIRDQRPRPHLDTKIVCAWNGLVLSGLSKLANCDSPKRGEYLNAASQLVAFIKEHLFDAERKVLLRSCYGEGTQNATLKAAEYIDGFLDDYAFVIKGLLDYYKSSLDSSILRWAKQLQDIQDSLFWDNVNGAYFYSQANAPNVIVRLKEDHDGAEPCGNSVAAHNLILLSHYCDEPSERVDKLFNYFADVSPFGYTLPEMMCALLLYENGLDLIAVVGPADESTKKLANMCRKFYIPGTILIHVDPGQPNDSHSQRFQDKFKMVNNKATVYICHNKVCRLPETNSAKLEEDLKKCFFRVEN